MQDSKFPVSLENTEENDFGRVATRLLFKQHNPKGEHDINEWREVFVSQLDPTEYAGGVALVGSWANWLKFKRNWPSFQKLYLEDWLDEIEVRLKSLAVRSLVQEAQAGKSATASAKFLAEGKYKERKAGRPSKDEVNRQINIDKELDKRVANDLERIGLKND